MEITKEAIYQLQPTISGSAMYHAEANRDSYYRGHLTQDAGTGLWIGWVEYDRDGIHGMQRAAVTKIATSLEHALALLNQRLHAKQTKNNGRLYQPIHVGQSGEITLAQVRQRLAFIESMQQQLAA